MSKSKGAARKPKTARELSPTELNAVSGGASLEDAAKLAEEQLRAATEQAKKQ
jgi:MinD-like ATPase involved in chromosome partitioning or flagellar assembly